MAERGIPFCGEMVGAILDGRKTQTRRVIRGITSHYVLAKKPASYGSSDYAFVDMADPIATYPTLIQPGYHIGDLLWVKETWAMRSDTEPNTAKAKHYLQYKANGTDLEMESHNYERWRSGRFMPKWAARIWLKVTGVKVERLQDINEEDARAEGVIPRVVPYRNMITGEIRNTELYYPGFCMVWKALHDKPGERWADNPWVFAYTLKRIEKGT